MSSMVTIGNITVYLKAFKGDQFSSVARLCLTLCNAVDRSMEGLPVHHHLQNLFSAQTEILHPLNNTISRP